MVHRLHKIWKGELFVRQTCVICTSLTGPSCDGAVYLSLPWTQYERPRQKVHLECLCSKEVISPLKLNAIFPPLLFSYRSAEEVQHARDLRDPILIVQKYALEGKLATADELEVSTLCVYVRICV